MEKTVISFTLNGQKVEEAVAPHTLLLDFVRDKGCLSVKRGCETSNCGLCTVLVDGKPMLSCTMLAVRAHGCEVTTLEGVQEEAGKIGGFLADQGAEQCGFCSPGLIMNIMAMSRELSSPTEADIRHYLAGNLPLHRLCGSAARHPRLSFHKGGLRHERKKICWCLHPQE